jgi:hypothetical protein
MQFSVRMDNRGEGGREGGEGRGGEGRGGEGREGEGRGGRCVRADMGVQAYASASARTHCRGCSRVRADASASARAHCRVRADASVLPPGNFKMDATVRPSHGRPHGHRPTVRPSVIIRVTTLAPTRGHRPTSARTRTHPRPRLYNPRPHSHFLVFLSFAFGWSCGICLATPISTCKGRRGHKHFEGDLLAFFAKQKFKGCIYPLDACVFSYAGVYVKFFKHRRRRN